MATITSASTTGIVLTHMSNLLFVYGTLRQGNQNDMAAYLARYAEFVTYGWFQGVMYEISYYPGVVATDNTTDRVYGEVYRLHDAEHILAILDDYEECTPQHVQPAEYQRVRARILAIDGRVFDQVFIYLYQWSIVNKSRVVSGDFMKL